MISSFGCSTHPGRRQRMRRNDRAVYDQFLGLFDSTEKTSKEAMP